MIHWQVRQESNFPSRPIIWSMLVFFLGMRTAYWDKGHKLLPTLSEYI